MKSREYFNKIDKLESKIKVKEERVAMFLEIAECTGVMEISDMPKPPQREKSPMEKAIVKAMDLEREIQEDKNQLKDMKIKVIEMISEIDSDTYQIVLMLRHLRKMKWESICGVINYSESGAMKLYHRAMSKLDKIFYKLGS